VSCSHQPGKFDAVAAVCNSFVHCISCNRHKYTDVHALKTFLFSLLSVGLVIYIFYRFFEVLFPFFALKSHCPIIVLYKSPSVFYPLSSKFTVAYNTLISNLPTAR